MMKKLFEVLKRSPFLILGIVIAFLILAYLVFVNKAQSQAATGNPYDMNADSAPDATALGSYSGGAGSQGYYLLTEETLLPQSFVSSLHTKKNHVSVQHDTHHDHTGGHQKSGNEHKHTHSTIGHNKDLNKTHHASNPVITVQHTKERYGGRTTHIYYHSHKPENPRSNPNKLPGGHVGHAPHGPSVSHDGMHHSSGIHWDESKQEMYLDTQQNVTVGSASQPNIQAANTRYKERINGF